MRRPTLLALLLATTLTAAAATGAALAATRLGASHGGDAAATAGADASRMPGGMAGDGPNAQLGMDRPHFPLASGTVPTADQAKHLKQISGAQIRNDTQFNPANGVRSGKGTFDDPYVISGLDVTGDLFLGDTAACVLITGNWIDGQLILDWNGQCVWVHHNFIRDLRVNENVDRTGADTGGLIEDNAINYVGQIRHYDGEFRDNVVGPRDDSALPHGVFDDPENQIPFAKDTRVLNIDGWNEALFDHNTVFGSVDLKLHGHHHSTGFLATHSHYHGDGPAPAGMDHMDDHTNRWESVSFTDNRIVDPDGYGLHYTDENHAGDDRTATSEVTKSLSQPHQHHTEVTLARNALEGAGLWVDIFNADDELHTKWNPGWFTIADNTIHLTERHPGLLGQQFFGPAYEPNTGIWIWSTKQAQFSVTGNTVTFQKGSSDPLQPAKDLVDQWLRFGPDDAPVAIALDGGRDANYTFTGNHATGFPTGLKADDLDAKVQWAVYGNDWGDAKDPVYYDDSVATKPSDQPLPPGPTPDQDVPPQGDMGGMDM